MKAKKCKVCEKKFTPIRPLQGCCTAKCAIEHSYRLKEKKAKKDIAEMKENIKTSSEFKQELQVEINRLIRLIDLNCPCISSGRKWDKNYQAGHYISRGAEPTLRFHLQNIWLQSIHDNHHLSGNFSGFRKTLESFGIAELMEDERLRWSDLKLTNQQLVTAKEITKGLVKIVLKANSELVGFRTMDERIMLRSKYNLLIGIYN